jgi:hypothetical protein
MKNILLFALLLYRAIAFAQSGEPVQDTSWIEKTGSQFFEVKKSAYADASELTIKTLIGDTAALVQATKSRIMSRAATMAVDVRHVSQFRRQIGDLLRESDAVATLTGIDPQRSVQNDYADPFLSGTWTIRRDGTASGVTFALNGQGALRYTVGASGSKAALLLGNGLRLKNYPANGTDTDLFMLPNGVWVDATRSVILRPPGNTDPVNRAAAPTPVRTKKG